MPSGAKKRKAAKKKLQRKANNNESHSNSQGSTDPKSYDERKNDSVVVEREENVEGGIAEVSIHTDDVGRNGNNKSSSGSSSSGSGSSSDDDEVVAEKDKSKEPGLGKVEASVGNAGVSEVVDGSFEESIPEEESIKQVVSLPQVSPTVTESVAVDSSLTSDVLESGMQQNVGSGVKNIADKVINVKDGCSGGCCKDTSEPESVTGRDGEGLLPQSSGVKAVEECYTGDESKAPETQKYVEEQPLLPSAPLPVRRTSWIGCCGLFEVFSGGASR
ncbi:hypothetical protein vseg_007366 [Gypsophila vaccaria]